MTDVTTAVAAGDLSFLDQQALNEWIVAQRWFASKTREVSQIDIVDCVPLRTESPLIVLCLVEARFPAGTHETYQVPLGLRPASEGWDERVILEADGWTVYDALADPAAGRELLHRMRANSEFQVGQDEFIFRWAPNAPRRPRRHGRRAPGRRRAVELLDRLRRRADHEGVPQDRAGREPRARAAALPHRPRASRTSPRWPAGTRSKGA